MAGFKTGYLQRELVYDLAVKGTVNVADAVTSAEAKAMLIRKTNAASLAAILVGDLVKLTPESTVISYSYEEMTFDDALTYTTSETLPTASAESADYAKVGTDPYTYYEKVTTETDYPAYIERVLSLSNATHLVAQSDITLDYGHVPIEKHDYRYFPVVNGTFASSIASTSPVKRVALFSILDKGDITIDAAQGETA